MGDELPAEEASEKGGDYYERLVLYRNPFNNRQKIDFPALKPRAVREAEQALVLSTLNTEQSDCGQFAYRKDLVASAECMLTQYWGPAIRRGVRDGTENVADRRLRRRDGRLGRRAHHALRDRHRLLRREPCTVKGDAAARPRLRR